MLFEILLSLQLQKPEKLDIPPKPAKPAIELAARRNGKNRSW